MCYFNFGNHIDCFKKMFHLMLMSITHQLLEDIVALGARRPDKELLMLFRRKISKLYEEEPDLAKRLSFTISSVGGVGATREFNSLNQLPKDNDSGMDLISREEPLTEANFPIFPANVEKKITRFVHEREQVAQLLKAGLAPPSSLALMGKPGTGKTSLARWIAQHLNLPFLTLNIAGVVTSYLGQTGQNIKKALDRAKLEPCLLLLDEFDALGYHRGDDSDVGEMRRVVTVLLQEIERWPKQSIIVAATNMPEQVDPAFRRRFSYWIELPLPGYEKRVEIIKSYYGKSRYPGKAIEVSAAGLTQASGADLEEFVRKVRTAEIVETLPPKEAFWQELVREMSDRTFTSSEKEFFVQTARKADKKYFSFRKLGAALDISHTSARRLFNP